MFPIVIGLVVSAVVYAIGYDSFDVFLIPWHAVVVLIALAVAVNVAILAIHGIVWLGKAACNIRITTEDDKGIFDGLLNKMWPEDKN